MNGIIERDVVRKIRESMKKEWTGSIWQSKMRWSVSGEQLRGRPYLDLWCAGSLEYHGSD